MTHYTPISLIHNYGTTPNLNSVQLTFHDNLKGKKNEINLIPAIFIQIPSRSYPATLKLLQKALNQKNISSQF